MRSAISCCLLILVFSIVALAAHQKGNRAALLAHLKRVTTLSDLPKRAVLPTEFDINFRVAEPDGQSVEGTYRKMWYARHGYRVEIHSPGYSDVLVSTATAVWVKSNPGYEPYAIHEATGILLGYGAQVNRGDRLRHAENKTVNGARLLCANVKRKRGISVEFCVDPNSFSPISVTWRSGEEVVEHTDYVSWHGWLAPRTVRAYMKGKLILTSEVTELTSPSESQTVALTPPSGPGAYHYSCDKSNPSSRPASFRSL